MKGATALRCAIMALVCACVYSDDGVGNLSSGVRRGSDQVNFSRCRPIMTLCLVKCYIHMSHKAIYVSSHFSHCSYCLPLSFVPLSCAKQVRQAPCGWSCWADRAAAMMAFKRIHLMWTAVPLSPPQTYPTGILLHPFAQSLVLSDTLLSLTLLSHLEFRMMLLNQWKWAVCVSMGRRSV
jgi:hypothetical protein